MEFGRVHIKFPNLSNLAKVPINTLKKVFDF